MYKSIYIKLINEREKKTNKNGMTTTNLTEKKNHFQAMIVIITAEKCTRISTYTVRVTTIVFKNVFKDDIYLLMSII